MGSLQGWGWERRGFQWLSHLARAANRSRTTTAVFESSHAHGGSLSRQLGYVDLVLLGIGASVGAGIFVITGTVAHDAGPGVTVSFLLAAAASVFNAFCYAELSSRFPAVVGGAYLYTYAVFNELTAFLVFFQLMLDYHIGAASIARSLASYFVTFLELFPHVKNNLPKWLGPSGLELFDGFVSISILAPIILALLTVLLCRGVRESSIVNGIMTITKIIIVLLVIVAGAFEVEVSNWVPFAPNGFKEIVTGATVVFFAYVGFDAVANSAEECKKPKRDLPIGILVSLLVCAILYTGVCLVLTGMVPYQSLTGDAPLAEAFSDKGVKFIVVPITIGAIAGLTTTLLVGLYVQSRLYLGLGRDGLLPSFLASVHPQLQTPVIAQIWVGCVAGALAFLFNVKALSHILSVGTLSGYSVVSACVVMLRLKTESTVDSRAHPKGFTYWHKALFYVLGVAACSFASGLCYRFSNVPFYCIIPVVPAIIFAAALHYQLEYADSPGFSCPGVPLVPVVGIFFNAFLFAQLHWEGWVRFVALSFVAIIIYALYGQHHAVTGICSQQESFEYKIAPSTDPESSNPQTAA